MSEPKLSELPGSSPVRLHRIFRQARLSSLFEQAGEEVADVFEDGFEGSPRLITLLVFRFNPLPDAAARWCALRCRGVARPLLQIRCSWSGIGARAGDGQCVL